jgi:hypothetical protein
MSTYSDGAKGLAGIVVAVVFVAAIVTGSAQCAPGPDKATSALRAHGFRDIAITDSHPYLASWYGCSEKDAVAHEATATNAAGERVSVVVCCGYPFKGCTVRVP